MKPALWAAGAAARSKAAATSVRVLLIEASSLSRTTNVLLPGDGELSRMIILLSAWVNYY
jgi:hypothetical protein